MATLEDLIRQKQELEKEIEETDIPEDMKAQAEEYRAKMIEAAAVISILFTYTILGTAYLSACLQTVSVCG